MRYIITIVTTILCIYLCHAENVQHENILQLEYGGSWEQDQYLSPLLYSGMHVGIRNEWWQPFRQKSCLGRNELVNNWQHKGLIHLDFHWMYNLPMTNGMYALGVQGGWGAQYIWKFPSVGLQIFLGPYIGLDYTARTLLNNINKPYSMDIATQIEATAGLSYTFAAKKSSYRLRYIVHTNLIGVDFMPDYWESYYELTEGISGIVRCAGPWNHRYLQQELTFDMQFRYSTWRIGLRHEYVEYGQDDLWFSREQICAVIGTIFHYHLKPNKRLTAW